MGNGFHVSTERLDEARWTVAATGELDAASAGYFEAAIAQVGDSDASLVELDLSGLTFIGAEGIRLLTDAASTFRTQGKALVVVAVSSFVHRVLDITRLAEHVERPPSLV